MNFFNMHHYCNGNSHCQRVRAINLIFYNLFANRNNLATRFGHKSTKLGSPYPAAVGEFDQLENCDGPAWIRTRDQGIMSPLLYR